MPLRIAVVGGSGFVGSAVCRLAVARGWTVTSFSHSGQPWRSPKGHQPAWTSQVDWQRLDVLDRDAVATSDVGNCDAAVHTLGILLETDYKSGSVMDLLSGLNLNPLDWARGGPSPLDSGKDGKYERINRDSALNVLSTLMSKETSAPRPFVYLSAEDIFRPIIPARYIETKREAERRIEDVVFSSPNAIRPIFVRPSLIYHPHIRPLSTLPATLIDLSATIQSKLPTALQARTLGGALPFETTASLIRLLSIPPIHVDTIAEAICKSIESPAIEGVMDVARMRGLTGFGSVAGQDRQPNAAGSL